MVRSLPNKFAHRFRRLLVFSIFDAKKRGPIHTVGLGVKVNINFTLTLRLDYIRYCVVAASIRLHLSIVVELMCVNTITLIHYTKMVNIFQSHF